MKLKLLVSIALLYLLALSATAQTAATGKVNTWTTKPMERRESSESTHLRTVRAAKQSGFDRVVFEFDGGLPNYTINYLRSRWHEDESGRHRLKLAGNAFVEVYLFVIPVDDEQLKLSQAKDFYPKGRLKFSSLKEVDEGMFFEGYYDFFLGIKSRKLFRVTELSNPSRLVIDFKH